MESRRWEAAIDRPAAASRYSDYFLSGAADVAGAIAAAESAVEAAEVATEAAESAVEAAEAAGVASAAAAESAGFLLQAAVKPRARTAAAVRAIFMVRIRVS